MHDHITALLSKRWRIQYICTIAVARMISDSKPTSFSISAQQCSSRCRKPHSNLKEYLFICRIYSSSVMIAQIFLAAIEKSELSATWNRSIFSGGPFREISTITFMSNLLSSLMKTSGPEKEPSCRDFLTQTLPRQLQLPWREVEVEMLRQLSYSWFLMQAMSSPLYWVQMVTAIWGEVLDCTLKRKRKTWSGTRIWMKLSAICISPVLSFIERNSYRRQGAMFYSSLSTSFAYSASRGPSIAMVSWMFALLMLIGSWADSRATSVRRKIFIMLLIFISQHVQSQK